MHLNDCFIGTVMLDFSYCLLCLKSVLQKKKMLKVLLNGSFLRWQRFSRVTLREPLMEKIKPWTFTSPIIFWKAWEDSAWSCLTTQSSRNKYLLIIVAP